MIYFISRWNACVYACVCIWLGSVLICISIFMLLIRCNFCTILTKANPCLCFFFCGQMESESEKEENGRNRKIKAILSYKWPLSLPFLFYFCCQSQAHTHTFTHIYSLYRHNDKSERLNLAKHHTVEKTPRTYVAYLYACWRNQGHNTI